MSHEKNKEVFRSTLLFTVIVLVVVFAIVGCTTVPVTAKFPEAPTSTEACPQLDVISDDVKLSGLTSTVTKNYSTYYECAVKVDKWNEWYQIQKRIFENIK